MMSNNANFSDITKLSDSLYKRESLLTSENINSFTPQLRFAEAFAETPSELNEYRKFNITAHKRHMVWNPSAHELMRDLNKAATEKKKITGHSWDGELTEYTRHFTKMKKTEKAKLENMQRPYLEESLTLWREEVQRFDLGFAAEWQQKYRDQASNESMYKVLMGELLAAFGFKHDSKLSAVRDHYFSRMLNDEYKLCITLDLMNLNTPFNAEPVVTRWANGDVKISSPSTSFYIGMVVRHIKDKKSFLYTVAPSFESLFPTEGHYRAFRSLNELETLIRIHAIMYRVIHTELETALLSFLQKKEEVTDIRKAIALRGKQ